MFRFYVNTVTPTENDEVLQATVVPTDKKLPPEFKVSRIDFEVGDTIINGPTRGYVMVNLHEGYYAWDSNHILHVSEWRQFN